jgi:hypothetical protein
MSYSSVKLTVQPDDIRSATEGKFSAAIEQLRATASVPAMCGGCENIDSSGYLPTSLGGKVAVNSLHASFQNRVEETPGFLGVGVGEQLHGAFQVSKENRDLLPLSLCWSTRSSATSVRSSVGRPR